MTRASGAPPFPRALEELSVTGALARGRGRVVRGTYGPGAARVSNEGTEGVDRGAALGSRLSALGGPRRVARRGAAGTPPEHAVSSCHWHWHRHRHRHCFGCSGLAPAG